MDVASVNLATLTSLAEKGAPSVSVAHATFAAYIEAHDAGRELLAAMDEKGDENVAERATELWIACAIASGSAEAVRLFEERYIIPLDRTLARMRLDGAALDDVKQLVRAKLLVRDPNGRAKIEEYAGRGRLAGLVQVVATREALTLLRKVAREVRDDDDLADPLVGDTDPGLEMLKAKYRDAFRAAFTGAVGRLTPKQRNLLRMHLLGGVTLEQLASHRGVHRATIVRWLKEARDEVLEATHVALRTTLGVRADELASLMALAQSRLDVSIERLLMTHDDPPDAP